MTDNSFIVEVTVGFYNPTLHRIPFVSMDQAVRAVNEIAEKLSAFGGNAPANFLHRVESMDGVSVFRVCEIVSVRACDAAAFVTGTSRLARARSAESASDETA